MNIGNLVLKSNIFLAPMAGITDYSFRVLCREFKCGLVYTEMISAKGIVYGNKKTLELLKTSNENPIAVQLFGHEPEILAEAIKIIDSLPFDLVDINMGCPAPKIIRNGDGSMLMKSPQLIAKIISECKRATKKPLTIKIRKGFDNEQINAVYVAQLAEQAGVDAIAIHGRTTKQQYSGKADWEIIKELKKSVSIPVIGNGDVNSPEAAKNIFELTGCDGIMIGRGALGKPWIFQEINNYLKGAPSKEITIEERVGIAIKHMELLKNDKSEKVCLSEIKKHIGWYTKGLKNSTELRSNINKLQDYNQIQNELIKFANLR